MSSIVSERKDRTKSTEVQKNLEQFVNLILWFLLFCTLPKVSFTLRLQRTEGKNPDGSNRNLGEFVIAGTSLNRRLTV